MSSIGSCGTTPRFMVSEERRMAGYKSKPVGTNIQVAVVVEAGAERVFCNLLKASDVSLAIRSMVEELMNIDMAAGEPSST